MLHRSLFHLLLLATALMAHVALAEGAPAPVSAARSGVGPAAAAPGASAPESPPESDYRLGAGDVVDVQVWREHEISGPHEIGNGGALRHALLGEVPATGLTVDELAEDLRTRLARDLLRDPRVSVGLVSSARRKPG